MTLKEDKSNKIFLLSEKKLIMLSYDGEYAEDAYVIGIFDKLGLALGYALKELSIIKKREIS